MTDKSLPPPVPPAGAAPTRSRMFTPYVLIWAGLATLSLIYLGLLATQPTTVADYLGAETGSPAAQADGATPTVQDAVAEVRSLRETLDVFRGELIEMRTQITAQSETARALATRVAAIEAAPAEDRVAQDTPAKDAKTAQAKKGAEEALPAPIQKSAAVKKRGENVETGSVAPPSAGAISFGPATVTPAAGTPPPPAQAQRRLVGVQIATGPSVDSLRLSWALLSERHADNFQALEPRYTVDASTGDATYDLVVGPLASVEEARRLCHELGQKATPCVVSQFSGDAL